MQLILAIGLGGGLGAIARHFLNNLVAGLAGGDFPYGILLINVLGSFGMGTLIAAFAQFGPPSQAVRAFLTVGILGGFTTFSTFSLDAVTLIERGQYGLAALYAGGSVGLGVGALFGGMLLVRSLAA